MMFLTGFIMLLYIPIFVVIFKSIDKVFPKFEDVQNGFKVTYRYGKKDATTFIPNSLNSGHRQTIPHFAGKLNAEISAKAVEASDSRLKLQIDMVYRGKLEKFSDVLFSLNETDHTVTMKQTNFYPGDYKNGEKCCYGNLNMMKQYSATAVHSY